jgi:O-antigen/teichoic acid export membrane protein
VPGVRRDISWAYAVSATRVLSWVVVYGAVYRSAGPDPAALLALVRWTLALLNYASAGLAPALLHQAALATKTDAARESDEATKARSDEGEDRRDPPPSSLRRSVAQSLSSTFHTGITLSLLGTTLGLIALWSWTLTEGRARHVAPLVGLFGTGMLVRLAADAWGAVIQSKGLPHRDYRTQAALELLWTLLATTTVLLRDRLGISWQTAVGGSYLAASLLTTTYRANLAHRILRTFEVPPPAAPPSSDARPPLPSPTLQGRGLSRHFDPTLAKHLLTYGGLVVLAQVADYLYAPTDLLLIRHLIDLRTVAIYAPAIQIDAGVLLLVSGLSTALLPLSAAAFGRGDLAQVRRYYIKGTLISLALLMTVSVLAYVAAPAIFKLWLGDKMTPTRRILPLVLIHTVIGGSSAVGRSVLLAIGRVRAFTAATLLAGLLNVAVSYTLVKYANLGLPGIVYGTILAVTARAALWQPWYTLRCLRAEERTQPRMNTDGHR